MSTYLLPLHHSIKSVHLPSEYRSDFISGLVQSVHEVLTSVGPTVPPIFDAQRKVHVRGAYNIEVQYRPSPVGDHGSIQDWVLDTDYLQPGSAQHHLLELQKFYAIRNRDALNRIRPDACVKPLLSVVTYPSLDLTDRRTQYWLIENSDPTLAGMLHDTKKVYPVKLLLQAAFRLRPDLFIKLVDAKTLSTWLKHRNSPYSWTTKAKQHAGMTQSPQAISSRQAVYDFISRIKSTLQEWEIAIASVLLGLSFSPRMAHSAKPYLEAAQRRVSNIHDRYLRTVLGL